MKRPIGRAAALLAVLWVGISCLDISSPLDGISSISPVIAPTPSVIMGDSSRDSLGKVDSLRVYAFNAKGDTVRDVQVSFFVLDTLKGLTVDAHGIAFGDTLSPSARVVAVVRPAGATSGGLQTSALSLPVTIAPDTVYKTSTDTLYINPTDTIAYSSGISVRVMGGVDRQAPVNAYLVRYAITHAPDAKAGDTAAFLVEESNKRSPNDTTNTGGDASRRVALRRHALLDEGNVWSTVKTDSVIVRVVVQYRGQDIPTSPIVVIVPIKAKSTP
jgi:hypothetical protein